MGDRGNTSSSYHPNTLYSSVTIRPAISSPSPTGPDVLAAGKGVWTQERDPFLLETSVPGVFAAGDVRHGSGERVVTAVGEVAQAVISVWQYLAIYGL